MNWLDRFNERATDWVMRAVSTRVGACVAALSVGIIIGAAQLGTHLNGQGL